MGILHTILLVSMLTGAPRAALDVTCDGKTEIEASRDYDLSIEEVWRAIGTADGLGSFLFPKVVLEERPGGLFEAHIFPDNPPGQRGLEGYLVLAYEPMARVMMTWPIPTHVAEMIGPQQSIIEFSVISLDEETTRVTIRQIGLGRGEAWVLAPSYHRMRLDGLFSNLTEYLITGEFDWEAGIANQFNDSRRFEELVSKHRSNNVCG